MISYRHTGKREYLNTAKKVADYFLSCIGEDGIPDADFRAPKEPVRKDNVAGGLAACGLIDCMMNLSLLYWASEKSGDPRFRRIAMSHADTAMAYFVREDGSCHHIVEFDPDTMAVKDMPGGQGYAPGSSWSRGQG